MSKLTGHLLITKKAVDEISGTCSEFLITKNLAFAGLPARVVNRDILDAITGGHWSDFAQKHHFMRRFDGQSPQESYTESVEWIRINAIESARLLAKRIRKYTSRNLGIAPHAGVSSCGQTNQKIGGVLGFIGQQTDRNTARNILKGGKKDEDSDGNRKAIDWQPFGSALHALQDSFARGHTVRGKALTETSPGSIEYIKMYAGKDVENHSHYDKLWEGENPGEFSLDGRLAVNASKALILMIIMTAQTGIDGHEIPSLLNWDGFKGKWLLASNKLSNERDFAIDLIEKYHTGARRGYTNWTTFNFDEAGLANAMVTELGSNSYKVYAVFERLDKGGYTTDIDDIALLYIEKIKNNIGISNAIRSNKKLVDLLVKSMTKGWTTNEEQKSIDFLQKK